MSLSGGNGIRLLLHLHAVADVLGQSQDGALIQIIVFEEICTVPFGLFGRLIEKVLHIGTHGFALHYFTAGKPEVTAEMVSGAKPLFNQRQLSRGIQTAAETAFHIIPVLVFAVAGFQLRAKRLDARTMPFSPAAAERSNARSSVRTISVVNSLVSSGTHRSPKWRVNGFFTWAVPSKRRYFRKAVRIASVSSSPLSAWSLPDRLRFSYYRWYLLNPKLLICFFLFAGQESAHHKMIIDMLVLCARRGMAVWIISSGIDAICEKTDKRRVSARQPTSDFVGIPHCDNPAETDIIEL